MLWCVCLCVCVCLCGCMSFSLVYIQMLFDERHWRAQWTYAIKRTITDYSVFKHAHKVKMLTGWFFFHHFLCKILFTSLDICCSHLIKRKWKVVYICLPSMIYSFVCSCCSFVLFSSVVHLWTLHTYIVNLCYTYILHTKESNRFNGMNINFLFYYVTEKIDYSILFSLH